MSPCRIRTACTPPVCLPDCSKCNPSACAFGFSKLKLEHYSSERVLEKWGVVYRQKKFQSRRKTKAQMRNTYIAVGSSRRCPGPRSWAIIVQMVYWPSLTYVSPSWLGMHCVAHVFRVQVNPSDWQDTCTVIGSIWGTLRNEACRPDGHRFIGVLKIWGNAIAI